MKFKLLPVTDTMLQLYSSPINPDRFSTYLKILQGGSKGHITNPVTFYNPMGKTLVFDKLNELKNLHAEEIIKETLHKINENVTAIMPFHEISVSLALADDLGGGWTNRYTTDYESKFKAINLLKRGFCNSLFWVSERYSPEKIVERTIDCCYRSLSRLTSTTPITLKDHIEEEIAIASKQQVTQENNLFLKNFELLDIYYKKHKNSNQYPLIFNFLYGDDASNSLAFPTYGIVDEFAGYLYAKELVAGKQQFNREFVLK